MSEDTLYDLQAPYNSECVFLKEPPLNLIPVKNLMWRNGDWSTLSVITQDYHYHIRGAFKELMEEKIIKHPMMIQAGGNSGLYPMLLTEFFATIVTFEPNSKNFHCLVNNCQSPNVIKFNCALGSKNGKIKSVEINDSNFGMSKVEEVSDASYIPMVTIDGFGFTDVGVIFLDVESYELEVLKGSVKTLEDSKPVVIVESYDDIENITEFLKEKGYSLYKKIGSNADYVFVHGHNK
jgi:FkbM family methyltransferase